ncbi:MAG: hypothetical protein QOH68_826, partial [Nocardioidaceae bacterium]|nr:hypothetical protein [Nocardioidaceae bacterium]
NTQHLLGHELAERVNDISYDTDPETLKMLNEILANRATDVKVMSSMYQDLEPQGTARAMSMLEANMHAYGDDAALDLAKTLRTGLATATKDPYFDSATFGHDLTRYFVAPLLEGDEQDWAMENMPGMNGASLLAFMMRDVDYGPEFLKSAADELAYFEKQSEDGFMPASVWYAHNGYSAFNEGEDLDYADPMAEMMRAMSRQPEVGYDFIREPGNADYFFDKRDWSNDGYDGISALADRVSTDPAIYRAHPEEAATIASQFVDWTANSPGFNAEDAKAASDSVSHLLTSYMPSMAAALDGGGEDNDPRTLPANLDLPGYGELDHMPQFYRPDLVSMTGVAMSTEDGMSQLAGGVADYRQTQITAVADLMADHPNDTNLHSELQSAMLNDSELRAVTTKIAGDNEISDAHDTDQQRQFWTNLLAEGAKEIPIKPPLVGTIVEHGIDLGTDAVNNAWANTAEGVTDDWQTHATNGIAQMNYESYASLVQAGVIPDADVPREFMDHGQIKGWNDIPADDRSSYGSRAGGELSPWVSDELLENTYRGRFETFFDNPGGDGG